MNTKFKDVLQGIGERKVAVLTEEGEKLIGKVLDVEAIGAISPDIAMFSNRKGILLQRERKLTFLEDRDIKSVKKAKPFETEIDYAH